MNKLAIAVLVCFVAAPALAQEKNTSGTQFSPPKITNEGEIRRSLDAMYKQLDDAMAKGDTTAEFDMIDFPVVMLTDNGQGEASSTVMTREQYSQLMSDVMKNTPAASRKNLKLKRSYDILSNGLVVVTTSVTDTVEGKRSTWKSATMLLRKNGKWMAKTMSEGGWGASAVAHAFRGQSSSMGVGGGGTMDSGSSGSEQGGMKR